jgi:hypothetical protein
LHTVHCTGRTEYVKALMLFGVLPFRTARSYSRVVYPSTKGEMAAAATPRTYKRPGGSVAGKLPPRQP